MIFLCFTNTHTAPSSVTQFTHNVHHIENSIKSGKSEGEIATTIYFSF